MNLHSNTHWRQYSSGRVFEVSGFANYETDDGKARILVINHEHGKEDVSYAEPIDQFITDHDYLGHCLKDDEIAALLAVVTKPEGATA